MVFFLEFKSSCWKSSKL